jgi:hypothetical protein
MSRYKPVGWRQESYRHYLAAKGIGSKRYFVRNELKGNRGSSLLHSLWAQGYSSPEIEQVFGVPVPQRRKKTAFDVPDRDVLLGARAPVMREPEMLETAPAPPFAAAPVSFAAPASVPVSQGVLGEVQVAPVEVTVSTPGAPPQPEIFDIRGDGEL